jgi:hypothetical protein
LNGTTASEEVEKYHKNKLLIAMNEANIQERRFLEGQREETHRNHISNIASEKIFD